MRTKKVKNKISKWDKLSNKAQTHIIQEKKHYALILHYHTDGVYGFRPKGGRMPRPSDLPRPADLPRPSP